MRNAEVISSQSNRCSSKTQESQSDLKNLKTFSSKLGKSLREKTSQKQNMDIRISVLASLQCFESSENQVKSCLNQLLKSREIPKGITRILSSYLENRDLLPEYFKKESITSLMKLAKEFLEEKLFELRRESSEEKFKEAIGFLHLLGRGTGQESLTQVAGLLLNHLEEELKSEKETLSQRVENLQSYKISFDFNDDSGYTLLFADSLLNGLGLFFSVLELERGLKVFSSQSKLNLDKASEGFAKKIGTLLSEFISFVLGISDSFFDVKHMELAESLSKLFIIVDDPSTISNTPNKFEWPQIKRLETYMKESCLIIQQTRLFLEEVQALYEEQDKLIFTWVVEESQTIYLVKACQTQTLSNFILGKLFGFLFDFLLLNSLNSLSKKIY